MPWPFKRERDPTDAPFARHLVAAHESWEERIAASREVEEPTRVALLGASAGAMVALGAYVMSLRMELEDPSPATGGRAGARNRIFQFAQELDDAWAAEAAYRVATWALLSEFVAHLWGEDYEYAMHECGKAFGFENLYEETTVHYGLPAEERASEDERMHNIVKASLYGMVSSVLQEPVEPEDESINHHLEAWIEQFSIGLEVGGERLEQLAPEGLGD